MGMPGGGGVGSGDCDDDNADEVNASGVSNGG